MSAKTWIQRSLVRAGALRLASKFAEGGVAIIMYHSVMNDPSSAETTLGGIIHSTNVFRGQIDVIARHFHAVTLDDVLSFLRGEKLLPPRAVVVTFDDGYADNYQVASDILSRAGIPGVFYVTVDCIDRQRLPWPSLLRYAFLTSKNPSWTDPAGTVWTLASTAQRTQAFEHASEYCAKLSGTSQDQFVEEIGRQLETESPPSSPGLMMTWDEVRGLTRYGHIVGSHTMTHPNMAYLSENDARTELLESKRRLEEELAVPITHFSYPCPALQPHWIDHTVSASRQIGYQTAVTTNGGIVRRQDDPLRLHRIRPTKTVEGLRWNLECAFLGRIV
ncbi:MAG TPA: polysaccharide deacetylase family protein [Candidatus Acidoferrum sp.]|nr:polysaccharide deacetylase family protein [Candidatus Acidoferrum sp.]